MARRSRYGIEGPLIGPGVMEQLSWIDIAKARLHIGEVIPSPDVSLTLTATGGSATAFTDVTLASANIDLQPGDLIRIVNGNIAPARSSDATPTRRSEMVGIRFHSTGANPTTPIFIGGAASILPGTSQIFVIPPGTVTFRFFSDQSVSSTFSFGGESQFCRIEYIKDN